MLIGCQPSRAADSTALKRAEDWLHPGLGTGWAGVWEEKQVGELGVCVEW